MKSNKFITVLPGLYISILETEEILAILGTQSSRRARHVIPAQKIEILTFHPWGHVVLISCSKSEFLTWRKPKRSKQASKEYDIHKRKKKNNFNFEILGKGQFYSRFVVCISIKSGAIATDKLFRTFYEKSYKSIKNITFLCICKISRKKIINRTFW